MVRATHLSSILWVLSLKSPITKIVNIFYSRYKGNLLIKWLIFCFVLSEEPTEIMYCENLGPIQNGRVQYFPPAIKQRSGPGPSLDYDLDDYPEGSVLEYSCDEGYKLVGRRSLTCQSTSYWSAKPPVCELGTALCNRFE